MFEKEVNPMIVHLKIRNYILIRSLDIDFRPGFTVITGETGAGKSILLGALGLILGERAESRQLLNEKEKCIIEGTFSIAAYELRAFFENKNLDYDDTTIIRREITENGKSRAFINDTPVTLADLKELGTLLVDIHSQHETLQLNSSKYQLGFVDAYARNFPLLQNYQTQFRQYRVLQMELQSLMEQESQLKKDLDYMQFQFNELHEAGLNAEAFDTMQQEIEVLNHAEEIKNAVTASAQLLDEQEVNVIDQLNQIKQLLSTAARYHEPVNALLARVQSVSIELKDIASDLQHIADNTVADGEKIELYNQKLNTIYHLFKKHQVKTVPELIALRDELEERIHSISRFDETIESLKNDIDTLRSEMSKTAGELSTLRGAKIPSIEKELQELLHQVGLVNAVVTFEHITQPDQFQETGIDKIQILFSGNKGSAPVPIHKAASGGELSRLMLCIKYIMARTTALPTLIFDEIDTGISGEVALKVSTIMKAMSKQHQVFAITHLPQIAGKGEHHFFVHKQTENNTTVTSIRALSEEERPLEIAKMIGGEKPSETALASARELMK